MNRYACYHLIFHSFFCSLSTLLKTILKTLNKKKLLFLKKFSGDDEQRSELVEKNKKISNYKEIFLFVTPCWQILEYDEYILLRQVRPNLTKRKYPRCDIKLHVKMRYSFKGFGECGVLLYCHYTQIHSDLW